HGLYQITPALLAFVPWCDVESPFDWASVRPYQEENLDKPDPDARLIAERGNPAVIAEPTCAWRILRLETSRRHCDCARRRSCRTTAGRALPTTDPLLLG